MSLEERVPRRGFVPFAQDGATERLPSKEVTEQGSGRPLPGAQVFIAGTTVGGVTNDRGDYHHRAPARQVECACG